MVFVIGLSAEPSAGWRQIASPSSDQHQHTPLDRDRNKALLRTRQLREALSPLQPGRRIEMAATMSAAAGPAAFSATARPGPAQHTPAHHQFAGSSSHPSQPTQIKLVSRSSGSVPQLGANGLGPAGGAESGASGVGSGPAMMSGQGGAGNARPGFVQDILSGDEDAVLSFQLAVRYSLRLRGEKVATHDGKAKAKDKVSTLPFALSRSAIPRPTSALHIPHRYRLQYLRRVTILILRTRAD